MKEIFSVLAGLLIIAGFVPYIIAIWRDRNLSVGTSGKTEPKKATWIICTGLDILILAGMYTKHAVNGQIIGALIGTLVVAIFALKYGAPGWTKLDKFCLAGAVSGVVLWKIFGNPTLGIMMSLGAMFLGFIPTFVSVWKDPSCEDKVGWTIWWVSCVCAIIAIPQRTLADAAQPITFLVINTIMMYILYVKHRKVS